MMDGSDTPASNLKTGKTKNANPRNARSLEHALMTYWGKPKKTKTRLDPQDIHARLILMIGATLALKTLNSSLMDLPELGNNSCMMDFVTNLITE